MAGNALSPDVLNAAVESKVAAGISMFRIHSLIYAFAAEAREDGECGDTVGFLWVQDIPQNQRKDFLNTLNSLVTESDCALTVSKHLPVPRQQSRQSFLWNYKILDLPTGASLRQIEDKARLLRAAYHPDKFQQFDAKLRRQAEDKFKAVGVALAELQFYWKTFGKVPPAGSNEAGAASDAEQVAELPKRDVSGQTDEGQCLGKQLADAATIQSTPEDRTGGDSLDATGRADQEQRPSSRSEPMPAEYLARRRATNGNERSALEERIRRAVEVCDAEEQVRHRRSRRVRVVLAAAVMTLFAIFSGISSVMSRTEPDIHDQACLSQGDIADDKGGCLPTAERGAASSAVLRREGEPVIVTARPKTTADQP